MRTLLLLLALCGPASAIEIESSNAATATALAANGADCSAGSYPLGVDASGAVESCTAIAATVVVSSETIVPQANIAETVFTNCVATVTLTTSASKAWVHANVTARNGSIGNSTSLTYLIDGAFPSYSGSTVGGSTPMIATEHDVANLNEAVSFSIATPTLTAASHSFCLIAKVSAGTSIVGAASSTFGVTGF